MSLKEFVRLPECIGTLEPLLASCEFDRVTAPMIAPPRTTNYALVGVAFDHALRAELQRRWPNAEHTNWMRAALIPARPSGAKGGDQGSPKDSPNFSATNIRSTNSYREATDYITFFLALDSPTRNNLFDLCRYCIDLARLESSLRSSKHVDTHDKGFNTEDVEDLLLLLNSSPYDALGNSSRLILNPDFGSASAAVSGADADLISGDRLIEIKVTQFGEIRVEYLRQLIGYFLLSRRHRQEDPSFPEIRSLGIYLARHGFLWTMPTKALETHPAFQMIEGEFWTNIQGYQTQS